MTDDAAKLVDIIGPHGVEALLRVTAQPGPAEVKLTISIHPGGRMDFDTLRHQKDLDQRPPRA